MYALPDGRIVVFGGYCKEKIKGPKSQKSPEKGKILTDMFLLVPDSKNFTIWTGSAKDVFWREMCSYLGLVLGATTVFREKRLVSPLVNKNGIIQGGRVAGPKWRHLLGKLSALAGHLTKKVNKAEELTYLSANNDLCSH